jgi:small subunit ribosomal protein S1
MQSIDNNLPGPEEQAENSIDDSFGDILREFEASQQKPEERSQTVQATVASITDEGVFLDIGRKADAYLPIAQARDRDGNLTLEKGQLVEVTVLGMEGEYYKVSLIRVEQPKDWSELQAAFDQKLVVLARVLEPVKGGLRVMVSGERGFLPASRSGVREVADLNSLVGQEIQCRITRLDTEKNDLVVDRRGLLEELEAQRRAEALGAVVEGAEMDGTVRSVMDYGAFVDIGGLDGLLHISDMSWTRLAKPSELVQPGEKVRVKVLRVNRETRKISLGMKQLVADPWAVAAEKFEPGARITGTVVRLADFGAFVELMPGVEGLIRTQDLSWNRQVRKPADAVKPGDTVEVVILDTKFADKKIGLSLKQALGDPWDVVEQKYPKGAIVEAPVKELAKFGAFVALEEGIDGMIHIADITREKRIEHPKEVLQMGAVVKAQVLELDREKRRIRLGMKQLEPTSVDKFITENAVGAEMTGRVIEVRDSSARVELGDGVFAQCRLPKPQKAKVEAGASSVDTSSMAAMLANRWKSGAPQTEEKALLRHGEIRNFRISLLDAEHRKIEVEMI